MYLPTTNLNKRITRRQLKDKNGLEFAPFMISHANGLQTFNKSNLGYMMADVKFCFVYCEFVDT